MEISIFAKKRTTEQGKNFVTYLSTLTKKTGEKLTVSVRFREGCEAPKPEICPINIIVDKKNANLSSKNFTNQTTGEVSIGYTLWVAEYEIGSPFVDNSLEDFV